MGGLMDKPADPLTHAQLGKIAGEYISHQKDKWTTDEPDFHWMKARSIPENGKIMTPRNKRKLVLLEEIENLKN